MNNNVVIAGCSSNRGTKLAKFLTDRGFTVYGVDRFSNDSIEGFARFFRIDLRHKDSMRLVMSIGQPDTAIFCGETAHINNSFEVLDQSYPAYLNFLINVVMQKVKRIVLCIETIYIKPVTPFEVSQNALSQLTGVFSKQYNLESIIITNKENLLREIKDFILKGGEEAK